MTLETFLHLTLDEIEKLTKISKGRWSRYFNGRISPTIETLDRAAAALGMSTSELVQAIKLRRLSKSKKSVASKGN